jgi:hypothetical protein
MLMNTADIASIPYLKKQVLTKQTSSFPTPIEIIQYIYGACHGAQLYKGSSLSDAEQEYIALKAVVDGNMIPIDASQEYRQAIVNFCVNSNGYHQRELYAAAKNWLRDKPRKATVEDQKILA